MDLENSATNTLLIRTMCSLLTVQSHVLGKNNFTSESGAIENSHRWKRLQARSFF